MFRVAVSGRRELEPSFFTVIVWRDQAEHAAQSLSKGSRVVVVGRLQQRAGGVSLRRVRAVEGAGETFLSTLKAGPAGGRPRRL
jgi:hypothetical protein